MNVKCPASSRSSTAPQVLHRPTSTNNGACAATHLRAGSLRCSPAACCQWRRAAPAAPSRPPPRLLPARERHDGTQVACPQRENGGAVFQRSAQRVQSARPVSRWRPRGSRRSGTAAPAGSCGHPPRTACCARCPPAAKQAGAAGGLAEVLLPRRTRLGTRTVVPSSPHALWHTRCAKLPAGLRQRHPHACCSAHACSSAVRTKHSAAQQAGMCSGVCPGICAGICKGISPPAPTLRITLRPRRSG